jgi:cellulose synthase/poly-beta-1,6-N-acetylglucosamine synthase-like glycosyltransferase
MIFIEIFFWLCIFGIFHSYVLFPLILSFLARNKERNQLVFTAEKEWPTVTIMMAVYNEELVLEEKLNSVFDSDYPLEKIQFLIGSDNSTDDSHNIIEKFKSNPPQTQG